MLIDITLLVIVVTFFVGVKLESIVNQPERKVVLMYEFSPVDLPGDQEEIEQEIEQEIEDDYLQPRIE